ncbi:MAG: methyltransferase domain-containing protein [Betaproteobacteria bacterium]|nr:methyltransferase domain-containing protein [Betaproteobacteria bacterium]
MAKETKIDETQQRQATQYRFPYHYLPRLDDDGRGFSAGRFWDFSKSYVTALILVQKWFETHDLSSARHVDVGCGDGGLIHHLRRTVPGLKLVGIDYDRNAIEWARLFNPDVRFHATDITEPSSTGEITGQFESASLIEVLEHISPEKLNRFVGAVSELLVPGGRLVVTVPHRNKCVEKKHFQHFDFSSISKVLEGSFDVLELRGFEVHSRLEEAFQRRFQNNRIFVEIRSLNRRLLRAQLDRVSSDETRCGRILVSAVKR